MANSRICSIPGCCKPVRVKSRGWCNGHWIRWSRYGDPEAGQRPRDAARRFLDDVAATFPDKDQCLLWPYTKDGHGYGVIGLDGERVSVHRYICEKEHGPPPTQEHEAAHSCGNGHLGCSSRHHLSWKTRSENFADKLIHGTDNRGEKNGNSSTTEDQARQILSLKGVMTAKEIAAKVGVTKSVVSHIHAGRGWQWLQRERKA